MSTTKQLIAIYRDNEECRNRARGIADGHQKIMSEKFAELQGLVKNGITTGDRILDFTIACGYSLGDNVTDCYRKLDESLRGHRGQLVLVVTKNFFNSNIDGPLFCGLLGADELLLTTTEQHPACKLPFVHYMYQTSPSSSSFMKYAGPLAEGGLPGRDVWVGQFVLSGLDAKEYYPAVADKVATVYVGNDAAKAWLAENRPTVSSESEYDRITRLLTGTAQHALSAA